MSDLSRLVQLMDAAAHTEFLERTDHQSHPKCPLPLKVMGVFCCPVDEHSGRGRRRKKVSASTYGSQAPTRQMRCNRTCRMLDWPRSIRHIPAHMAPQHICIGHH